MANDMNAAVDMLKDLLSSPDAGEKISSMLGALGMDEPAQESSPDLSSLAGLLGGKPDQPDSTQAQDASQLPIANIMKLTNEYQKLSHQDDPRVNLLRALRPYLRPHRLSNLDNAIKILGLVKLAPLLGELKDVL